MVEVGRDKYLIKENKGFKIYWYIHEQCYRVFKDGKYLGITKYTWGDVACYVN